MSSSPDLPCPCCGFLTLEAFYGSYVICDVCGWEDDGVQLANPTSGGGANSESLREAQQKSLLKYPRFIDLARGYRRSRRWRPLSSADVERAEQRRTAKHWYAGAVCTEAEAYWADGEPAP